MMMRSEEGAEAMKIEAKRVLVADEFDIIVTVQSRGAWGHSLLTDHEEEIHLAADAAAHDIADKVRRIPKKAKG
jgi:hypothetical protein